MARIADAELARLKAEVAVARLVEGCGVELKRQGADLIGRCPLHEDRTPSLLITPSKNLWHCLGACQTGGSVVDWVMAAQGVSFRHAVELLREDSPALSVLAARSPRSGAGPVKSLARKLATIEAPEDDHGLLGRVLAFYSERLPESSDAMAYLAKRKIDHPEALEVFGLGFADRTLGYRLGHSQTKAGAEIRSRLQGLGILRSSGHEHFRGSLVIPVRDELGFVGEVYGRKVRDDLRAGTPLHLYLPGPHRGVFNYPGFSDSGELIITESLIDALTLWSAGFRHVTASFGADGFTDGMHSAIVLGSKVKRVLIAYDRDKAGDNGAQALAGRLLAEGIECFRVELPSGADINSVAVAADDPQAELARFLRAASWMGQPSAEPASSPQAVAARLAAASFNPAAVFAQPAQPVIETEPEPVVEPQPEPEPVPAPAEPMAAGAASPVPSSPLPDPAETVDHRELVVSFAARRWRVRGLDKVTSFDSLRVNLLVARTDADDVLFHVDTLDLYSARARAVFIAAAAAELGLGAELVKADLGRVLLACETRAEDVITAAQAPAKPEVTISARAREAALELLRSPELIGRIESDFGKVGMVGEATNCLVGYLAAVSRKLPSPLAVIVQSTSAAGKSAVMEAVLGFVPPEDRVSFSAMTGQSLFYMGESDLAHKVLSIAEEEGASRAAYALKLLQSEGEISIASTGKDTATGRLVTHAYTVTGPTSIILTTTAIDIDEELLNRCLVLTVDEDRDQTRAIHAAQRQAQTLAGLTARTQREAVISLHRDAQRLIEPLAVVNPFADRLTFADGRTRTRRDHQKYLGLIAAVTLLHQHQRERRQTVINGKAVDYVESTLADIEIANRLAHRILGQSLDELAPQIRRILTAIHAHLAAEAKRVEAPITLLRFTRRQIREALGFGDTQLKIHLARLADLELILAHRLESGAYAYELLWRGEGSEGQPFLTGLTDPKALKDAYDGNLSGQQADRSGPGRRAVGGRSRPGIPENPCKQAGSRFRWQCLMGKRGEHTPLAIPGNPADPQGFPVLVEEFLTDLAVRGFSEATIRNRRGQLAQVAAWLQERGISQPVQVTRPILVRYQRHLFHYRKPDGQPLSFRSQNARLLPIRAFFKWAVKAGHVASNPASDLDLPKVEQRLPKPALTLDEAELVMSVPDLATTSGVRDRAMLEVLYNTGIRRGELARLHLGDIDTDRGTLMVRQGKGKKDRMIPIGERAVIWVEKYLTDSRPLLAVEPDDGTLFLTVDGTPFSLDRLTQLARDYVKASGVSKEGACHLFRHTMATLMLEGGADIRYIQAMLGHAELSTTQIYTQVSIRALQAVHAATHPASTNQPRQGRHPVLARRDDPERKVSPADLLAVLEQENEEENRPHPGSTS